MEQRLEALRHMMSAEKARREYVQTLNSLVCINLNKVHSTVDWTEVFIGNLENQDRYTLRVSNHQQLQDFFKTVTQSQLRSKFLLIKMPELSRNRVHYLSVASVIKQLLHW